MGCEVLYSLWVIVSPAFSLPPEETYTRKRGVFVQVRQYVHCGTGTNVRCSTALTPSQRQELHWLRVHKTKADNAERKSLKGRLYCLKRRHLLIRRNKMFFCCSFKSGNSWGVSKLKHLRLTKPPICDRHLFSEPWDSGWLVCAMIWFSHIAL